MARNTDTTDKIILLHVLFVKTFIFEIYVYKSEMKYNGINMY